ncbi:hypothetical protein LUZ60_001396 [Juncus effusus]|nr:hypothetical protein LUZ60_001396 [Juncus effusus]
MAFLRLFLFTLLVSTTLALNLEEITPFSATTTLVNGPLQYNRVNFTLYFHQIFETSTITIFNPNPEDYPNFGQTNVMDVPLFDGTASNASLIARWQGLAVQSDVETVGWHLSFSVVFSNADTIQVMGREAPYRTTTFEFSIIGGTGKFQMARGYIYGRLLSSPDDSTWIELRIIAFCPLAAIHPSY